MLYLLKSPTTNEYLQENLQIMAMPAGWRSTVSYATRWVPPDLWGKIRPGEEVCLVLSQRPYQRFVPTRRGVVQDVIDEAGDLTLTVTWRTFAGEVEIDAFSRRFRRLNQGTYFVVRDGQAPISFIGQDEDDRAAWHRIVSALRVPQAKGKTSQYANSLFLRVLPLLDSADRPLPVKAPLYPGTLYRQPLRFDLPDAANPETYRVMVDPGRSSVQVPGSVRLDEAEGDCVSVELHPLEAGAVRVQLWVTPNRGRSTALSLNYAVDSPPAVGEAPAAEDTVDREMDTVLTWPPQVLTEMGDGKEEAAVEVVGAEPVPEAAPRLSDPDVRAIVDAFYVEDEAARLRELLGLIQQTLYPLAPDSAYLLEQHGRLLFRLEQWQRAYEQFEAIDPDRLTPEAVVMWFVSACRAGINAEFDTILGYFNAWEQTALTDQLIEVLPLVSAERRLGILEGAWLGAGRYGKVWETVRATFARDDHVLRAVQLMVDPDLYNLLSPAQGYGYLYDHVESWAGAPADHLEQAVQWGLAEPDRVEDLEEAFLALVTCRLTRADDPEALLSLVEEGRALSPYTWAEAAEQVADALAGHESAVWRAMAGSLYVNLARHYRERLQNLDAAEESLTRAHLLAGEGTDAQLEAHIEAEEAAWTEAVEGLEQIRMWRDGMIEVRLKRLRAHMHGKRAIFVGGLKRSFDVETIRVELGLDEAEFIPHFQSERGNLGKIQNAIHQGKVDYVVDFIRFGAHRNLDQHCEGTPVTYVRVPSGRSLTQIVRALSAVHQIDLQ